MLVSIFWSVAVLHAQDGPAVNEPRPLADQPQPVQIGGDPARWREVWEQMMPVWNSPRCMNCHRDTSTESGANHGVQVPERVENLSPSSYPASFRATPQCPTCHTARSQAVRPDDDPPLEGDFGELRTGPWNKLAATLTQPDVRFPGSIGEQVDPKAMCDKIAPPSSHSVEGLEHVWGHLVGDERVQLAFEGRKGDAIPDFAPAQPPPLSHSEFREIVRAWLTQAAGACDLNGTITITETLQGNRSVTSSGGVGSATIRQEESGSRTVNIDVRSGKATVSVQGSGQEQTTQTTVVQNCTTTSTSGVKGSSSGNGEGDLHIIIAADGSFTINLTGPPETGSMQLGGASMRSCLSALNIDEPGQPLPVPRTWAYGINAGQRDPNSAKLTGSVTKTITWAPSRIANETIPWLLYGLTLAPEEGPPPSVTLTTTWDLTLY